MDNNIIIDIPPQTLVEISITSKAQYAMFSRSLFFD